MKRSSALAGAELIQASGEVIAARMEILRAGLVDPSRADLTEIALMSSEKVEAAGRSALVMGQALASIGDRLGREAGAELGRANQAAQAVASASDPLSAVQAQYAYALGWWSRAAEQALRLNAELIQAQDAALRPIHKAATANARRLRKA